MITYINNEEIGTFSCHTKKSPQNRLEQYTTGPLKLEKHRRTLF